MKLLSLMTILTQTIALSASAGVQQIDNIKISSSVPQDQATRLIKDIQILKAMNLNNPDPNMLSLMQISDGKGSTLAAWLEERVNFIVDENMKLDSSTISDANGSYNYPNDSADQQPTIEKPTKTPDGDSTVHTMMLNIGGGLYYGGKTDGALFQIAIPGIGKEEITSPRIGMIQVGAGLFGLFFAADQGKDPLTLVDTMPYVAERISTLIHEARHSDGNGKSLGFFHATCPDSMKDYGGYAACDRNLNGPYQIETTFLNSLAQSCPTCSTGDILAIKLVAADTAKRQIVSTPDANDNSQGMIEALQAELDYCKIVGSLPVAIPNGAINCADTASIQAQITALQSGGATSTASTMWDPTPEGTFSAK